MEMSRLFVSYTHYTKDGLSTLRCNLRNRWSSQKMFFKMHSRQFGKTDVSLIHINLLLLILIQS